MANPSIVKINDSDYQASNTQYLLYYFQLDLAYLAESAAVLSFTLPSTITSLDLFAQVNHTFSIPTVSTSDIPFTFADLTSSVSVVTDTPTPGITTVIISITGSASSSMVITFNNVAGGKTTYTFSNQSFESGVVTVQQMVGDPIVTPMSPVPPFDTGGVFYLRGSVSYSLLDIAQGPPSSAPSLVGVWKQESPTYPIYFNPTSGPGPSVEFPAFGTLAPMVNQTLQLGCSLSGIYGTIDAPIVANSTTVPATISAATPVTPSINNDYPDVVFDSRYIYWTDGAAGSSYGSVYRMPLDGGPADAVVLATNQYIPSYIAVDSEYVYWINQNSGEGQNYDGTINKVPIGGGDVSTIASGLYQPYLLICDNDNVYWTSTGWSLYSTPKTADASTLPTLLLPGSDDDEPTIELKDISTDGVSVYFLNASIKGSAGDVIKVSCSGGDYTVLAPASQNTPGLMALHGGYVYWTANGVTPGVMRIPVGGDENGPTNLTDFTPLAPTFSGIVVNELGIFFAYGEGILRMTDDSWPDYIMRGITNYGSWSSALLSVQSSNVYFISNKYVMKLNASPAGWADVGSGGASARRDRKASLDRAIDEGQKLARSDGSLTDRDFGSRRLAVYRRRRGS